MRRLRPIISKILFFHVKFLHIFEPQRTENTYKIHPTIEPNFRIIGKCFRVGNSLFQRFYKFATTVFILTRRMPEQHGFIVCRKIKTISLKITAIHHYFRHLRFHRQNNTFFIRFNTSMNTYKIVSFDIKR